jgi:hypothetical protein
MSDLGENPCLLGSPDTRANDVFPVYAYFLSHLEKFLNLSFIMSHDDEPKLDLMLLRISPSLVNDFKIPT